MQTLAFCLCSELIHDASASFPTTDSPSCRCHLSCRSLSCRVAFVWIGSRVDAQGMLREPFALLPISALLLLGCGLALIRAWALYRRRR